MSSFGHADTVTKQIANERDRQAWRELSSKPLPKLLLGYESAMDVSFRLKDAGMIFDDRGWRKQMGYADNLAPVMGAIYISETIHHQPQQQTAAVIKAEEKQQRMLDELRHVGCNAVGFIHVVEHPDKSMTTQIGIFHPDMIINTEPRNALNENPTAFDKEGRALFLAYLLQTRKVSVKEAKHVDAENHFLTPFGPRWVEAAKDEHVQKTVRDALQKRTLLERISEEKEGKGARKR